MSNWSWCEGKAVVEGKADFLSFFVGEFASVPLDEKSHGSKATKRWI